MKKTFPLQVSGLKPERVIDSIKHEVRRYLKRERRKTLPEGADFWDFDCRVGPDGAQAESIHVTALNKAIDATSLENQNSIYLEVLAKPGHRSKKETENEL